MVPETELAWAAGFFDGEGTTGTFITRAPRGAVDGYCHLHMKVGQVRREPLDRFAAAVGVGNVTGPYIGIAKRQPIYTWQVGGNRVARQAIERLMPYLSEPKREQIERALAVIEARPELARVAKKRRIIGLAERGLTPLEIARAVGLSRRTVYYHLQTASAGGDV